CISAVRLHGPKVGGLRCCCRHNLSRVRREAKVGQIRGSGPNLSGIPAVEAADVELLFIGECERAPVWRPARRERQVAAKSARRSTQCGNRPQRAEADFIIWFHPQSQYL